MVLHTLNASPASAAFADCLRLVAPGDALLLLGDSVYGAIAGTEPRLALNASGAQLYVLREDASAAGVPLELIGFEDARARSDEVLAEVGLAERGHHYPAQLSGGEQQRVALARAFASRPALLLADEPTGNLDSETGGRVLELLLDMRARHGTTLVLVTHDAQIAARAGRQVHLLGGRIARDTRAERTEAGG